MPGKTRWRPARRNVVAAFRDMRAARKAIDALEARGFEAVSISLEGAAAQRAESQTDTAARDAKVVSHVGFRAGAGMLIGGAIGLAVALVAAGVVMKGSALAIIVAGVAGTVVGSTIGMMVAGVGSLDMTPDWELTFEDQPGRILVAVGAEDPDALGRAGEVLKDLDPVDVRRVDERGRPVS